jgi:hypothetical protein
VPDAGSPLGSNLALVFGLAISVNYTLKSIVALIRAKLQGGCFEPLPIYVPLMFLIPAAL